MEALIREFPNFLSFLAGVIITIIFIIFFYEPSYKNFADLEKAKYLITGICPRDGSSKFYTVVRVDRSGKIIKGELPFIVIIDNSTSKLYGDREGSIINTQIFDC